MANTIRKRNVELSAFEYEQAEFKGTSLSDRKAVRKAVLREDKLFKIIAYFSPDWIYWIDPNNEISFVSPSCKYLTGYDCDEMQNEMDFWKRIIHPHDYPRLENHFRTEYEGNSLCMEEFRIITKNGGVRWITHMCEPVYNEDDKYLGRYACNKESVSVKPRDQIIFKSGDYIYKIFDNASIGYYQIYFDGRIKRINDYMLNLLGYNSIEEFDQLNFEDYCIINVEKRMNFKSSMLKNGFVKDFESEWIRKDGTLLYLRETATAVENPDGSFTYYEGIADDITEKKEAEETALELSFERRKTEELKTEFLAMISHEIRTPLNVILNFARILKTDYSRLSPDELNDNIKIIEKEGKRIQRTIGLLLEMAELRTGSYDFNVSEIDLVNDIFLEVYRNFQNEAFDKDISFSLVNELEHATIIGDKHGVYQIFNQLTDNAIKYTLPGGSVIMKLFRDEDKRITAEISDTGIGIKQEYLPLLFKAFSQEDLSYSRIFEGTGLGLAVVERHCELNGAAINVYSEKNKGTNFVIRFKS